MSLDQVKEPLTVANYLRTAIGDIDDNVLIFKSSLELDHHIKSLIQASDVANCSKWSEMHEFAHDLNDKNLEITLINDIERNLQDQLNELNSIVRKLDDTAQFELNDDLLFFAYKSDQEEVHSACFYRMFILNELTRTIEQNKTVFNGLTLRFILSVLINSMLKNASEQPTKQCFELIANLKCTLADVAKNNLQYWNKNSEEWLSE